MHGPFPQKLRIALCTLLGCPFSPTFAWASTVKGAAHSPRDESNKGVVVRNHTDEIFVLRTLETGWIAPYHRDHPRERHDWAQAAIPYSSPCQAGPRQLWQLGENKKSLQITLYNVPRHMCTSTYGNFLTEPD
ncbi:hypothetical protein ACRALDRAFT_1069814 [Sodiomyces alcalophilus JCM 7366]|uniref:uncharacterized protein n=1 Tax=Sodiomyces alcalophilus JCM 7366 TaxID=591952 RepID=UPI0039B3E892